MHPETNTNPFALMACWYGPMAAGASDITIGSGLHRKNFHGKDHALGVETALMVDIRTRSIGKWVDLDGVSLTASVLLGEVIKARRPK